MCVSWASPNKKSGCEARSLLPHTLSALVVSVGFGRGGGRWGARTRRAARSARAARGARAAFGGGAGRSRVLLGLGARLLHAFLLVLLLALVLALVHVRAPLRIARDVRVVGGAGLGRVAGGGARRAGGARAGARARADAGARLILVHVRADLRVGRALRGRALRRRPLAERHGEHAGNQYWEQFTHSVFPPMVKGKYLGLSRKARAWNA